MQTLKMDFQSQSTPPVVPVMQSDSQSRFIGITLYNGGVPYEAPEGASYTVQYCGPGANNMGWYDTITLSSGTRKAVTVDSTSKNVVTLELAEQALRVNGNVFINLCVVTNTGYMKHTFPILCRVTGAAFPDTVAVQSFFYVTGITSEQWLAYVTACQDAQKRAEDAAATFETDPTLSVSGKAADAKETGDKIGQLKEELVTLKNMGDYFLSAKWIRGYLDSTGTANNASYRAIFEDYIICASDVTVSVLAGYQFAVGYKNADGSTRLARPYNTNAFVIPANTKFKVSVYALPEDTSSGLIDPETYGKTIEMRYQTVLMHKIAEIDGTVDDLESQVKNNDMNFITKKYRDIFENKICHVDKIVNPGANTSYVDNKTFSSSEFIFVEPETTYIFGLKSEAYGAIEIVITRIIFYDADKKYLSYIEGGHTKITTPQKCKYMIFSTADKTYGLHNSFDNLFIEESDKIVSPFDLGFCKNILTGEKWMVIGDSITEKNFRTAANYHDFIRAETGCEILNCGVSGSGYAMMHSSNKSFRDRIPTYSGMAPDFITIMGGINDVLFLHQGGTAATIDDIGTYTDVTENSVMGCVYLAYVQMIATFPNTPFGIMSPVPNSNYNPQNQDNVLAYFVNELKKFCEYYGVPYLDQYHFSNLRPWDAQFNKKFFSCPSAVDGDGLHPNYYGHKMIYPKIREFIKTLL